uniref:Rab-GAP TBC domain-containing protein n=1 Tax=Panagrolaimus davidi TaxID=227884 RepID=A0A914QCA0_9BILA
MSEIAKKGCYTNREKTLPATIKWIPKPIDNFEILCQILIEYRSGDQQQPPFAEMIKQIIQNSKATDISIIKTSSPTTSSTTFLAWISSISNYAIFLGKTSSRQFTHRQSLLLKIPFYDFESGGKDWFLAAIFLAEKCNAKKTSEILSTICSSSIINIRSFWAAAHESLKEFIDYLASDLWPIICKFNVVGIEKPRFGIFVNFVYRAGIGLMDFKDVEEYILIAILGGKIAVIVYFISYWNQLKMASNERLSINKILQCYLKIQDDIKKL